MAFIGEQETSDIISSKSYLGTLLLGTLPIIGEYLLIKWSKSKDVRVNKQNLCKAYLKLKLIMLYPILIVAIVFTYLVIGVV